MIELQVNGKKVKTLEKSGEDFSAVQVHCGPHTLEFPLTLDDAVVNITLVPRPETDLGLQTKKREAEERDRIETTMNQEALDAAQAELDAEDEEPEEKSEELEFDFPEPPGEDDESSENENNEDESTEESSEEAKEKTNKEK